MLGDQEIREVINSKSETAKIDFKLKFETSSTQDWCEIIKDIVAISNSGGGCIIIGLQDDATLVPDFLINGNFDLDPAVITDKIYKYTSIQLGGFRVTEFDYSGYILNVIHIPDSNIPIPFNKPGTYGTIDGKQKRAFSKGTVYFRHGAKSEPATYDDMRTFFDKKLEKVRKEWFKNIRKVMEAPPGSGLKVMPPEIVETKDEDATKIRITEDENAPVYRKLDPDITHPYRQTELVDVVNEKLNGRHKINSYDIQSIKNVHEIKGESNFYHKLKFGGCQYSEEFADWIVKRFDGNPDFFQETRDKMYQLRYDN